MIAIQSRCPARRGVVLLVIAGMSALLVSLALAFLLRMRTDAEENQILARVTQARIMLVAACSYLREGSRLGLDDPATPEHEEGFGWIDVRDGKLGPKTSLGADDDSHFPVGSVVRCPMYVMRRPPFAVSLTACCNPIDASEGSPALGLPYLRNPDPLSVATTWSDFASGDRTPRRESEGLSWFRVLRTSGARFVVSCGAGATRGFRSWPEALAAGESGYFRDAAMFADLRANEIILWYAVEWSAATGGNVYHDLDNDVTPDHYLWRPFNASHDPSLRSQSHARNLGGTIRWVQRLGQEPPAW